MVGITRLDRLGGMDDLDVALAAARAGGDVIRRHFGTNVETEWKGAVDPVTEVDRLAEEAILAVIRAYRPDDRVLAEESGGHDWDQGRVWIVDPIDGTVNFVHALPQVA
jgi:myo-inositol-1(or 4)-monophosphatase